MITVLVDRNPKRAGSKAAERFARYVNGMTYGEALKAGIRRDDVYWDLERRFVEVDGELPKQRRVRQVVSNKFDLNHRSAGEELWLWRSRRLSPTGRHRSRVGTGMSQLEAANELGITVQRYNDAENDRLPERDVRYILTMATAFEQPPNLSELLALARRRSGMVLAQVCAETDTSRQAYLKREHSGDPRVVGYWRGLGYIF